VGYAGKLKEKEIAIKLRKKGKSYNEIRNVISISKSTLSHWCRDIILSPAQLERLLKRKLRGSEKGRIIGAKIQQQRRLKQIDFFRKQGAKDIGKLSNRDKFLIGIALYAGEGSKGDKSAEFANSDPVFIKFMMNWFIKFCNVPMHKFRGAIWIHENLNAMKARKFWSKLTEIPESQFNKTYIAENKVNSRKIRKKRHEYGVFSIRISDVKTQRKILGWISGILNSQMV